MLTSNAYTTVQISKDLKTSLQLIGKKGQTYNDIIQELLENHGAEK